MTNHIWWNPLFWWSGHCWHHVRTEKRVVLCRNGQQQFAFPQVANSYDLNKCCECGKAQWLKDDSSR